MNPFQVVLLFFLIIPFIEIYLLLQIGGIVGVLPTVLLVVFTAVLGAWLLRQQGLATWQRLQNNLAKGAVPAFEMIEGPILLVGGALLLTPGFFTDALGFAFLNPATRKKLAQYIIDKGLLKAATSVPGQQQTKEKPTNVIEGEYKKEE
jgi:UPF0716 protein FxsA